MPPSNKKTVFCIMLEIWELCGLKLPVARLYWLQRPPVWKHIVMPLPENIIISICPVVLPVQPCPTLTLWICAKRKKGPLNLFLQRCVKPLPKRLRKKNNPYCLSIAEDMHRWSYAEIAEIG